MDNVPDPTDFPSETDAPGLRSLDSAFSCQICGELYDAPMILNCSHSFCSMCVRRSLRDRHECPTCRSPAEEVHLVKNVQLEDLCDNWRTARDTVLKLIDKVDELAKPARTDLDTRPKKRRKFSSPVASGPSTDRNSAEIVIEDSDVDAETPNHEYVPSSDVEENESERQMRLVVDCPICSQPIISRSVNEHIDSGCKSFLAKSKDEQASARNAWNNILGSGSPKVASRVRGKKQQKPKSIRKSTEDIAERIPKPSYNVLKDKKIRDMLSEYQLPTAGTREELIARHTQFVLLFNANLDRATHLRKSLSELKRDLKRWEDGLRTKKVAVDDTQAYIKNRSSEFKKHIEAARASLKTKAQDSTSHSGQSTAPASSSPSIPSGELTGSNGAKLPSNGDQLDGRREMIIPDSEGEEDAL